MTEIKTPQNDEWGSLRADNESTRLGVPREKEKNFTTSFNSEIVKVGKTLTKHISGASIVRAVVYVSNPIQVLEFLENHDVGVLELVMGHQRVHDFKSELTPTTVEKLIKFRQEGRLRLYVSDKVHYHSKLYICEYEDKVIMINGSANLTKTGLGIKGTQWNHIWIYGISGLFQECEDYQNEMEHFETYRSRTEEFFGDFAEAFEQIPEEKKIEIVENWIASGDIYGLPEDAQIQKVTRLIIDEVMNPDLDPEQLVVSIVPHASSNVVEKVTTGLKPIGVTIENEGTITVPRAKYLNHKIREFPLMTTNFNKEVVNIGWGGTNISRTAKEYDTEEIKSSLEGLEDFVNSVEIAEPEFPELAKTSIAEAILYTLSTPFHHRYMEKRREIFGITEERGPRILHLYGGTSNGKSKLLTYCSKLLTGHEIIQPLDGDVFSDSKVSSLRTHQSVYPMMWDDLPNAKWTEQAEKVIKTHWDKRWTPDEYCPQLILTSNRQCPRGPLQTRVKEINLSSTYPRSTKSRVELAKHLKRKNPIFEFFSKAYFEQEKNLEYSDDEAFIARAAIKQLYDLAKMKPPSWMPLGDPLEDRYSPASVQLLKAIIDGACTIQKKTDEIVLDFDEGFNRWEIKPYIEGIPNEVDMDKKGYRVFIRRPDRFNPWLRNAIPWIGKRKVRWKIRRMLR